MATVAFPPAPAPHLKHVQTQLLSNGNAAVGMFRWLNQRRKIYCAWNTPTPWIAAMNTASEAEIFDKDLFTPSTEDWPGEIMCCLFTAVCMPISTRPVSLNNLCVYDNKLTIKHAACT